MLFSGRQTVSLGIVATIVVAPAVASAQRLVTIPMSPPKTVMSAAALGPKPAGDVLHLEIALPFRDPVAAQQYVDAVSNPSSSQYRQFLSPEQVGSRFGLPTSSISKVTSWLTSQGMKVGKITKNHLMIFADATVAQAEAAFHTSIENYTQNPVAGASPKPFFSFIDAPSIPAEIYPYVIQIGGLQNGNRPKRRDVNPNQLHVLYSTQPMYTAGNQGQGRTIGVSSFDGFRKAYLSEEYSMYSLPTPSGGVGTNVSIELSANADGGAGSGTEYGEGDLDLQSVCGMAPLANVIMYDGGGGDLEGVLALEAEDDTCDVITESYGWDFDLPTNLALHNLHVSMGLLGITYMAASGDSGTDNAYVYPDQDPEVMMVGGTQAVTDATGNRTSEDNWSNEYGAGTGGWFPTADTFNVLPTYQSTLPKTINNVPIAGVNYRLVPDIAFNADPANGYDVYLDYFDEGASWEVFGGTSGASPTCAAGLAVTEQKIIAAGGLPKDALGHQRFGRIQDLLYSFNGDPTVFYDVSKGASIGLLPNGYQALPTTGWDFTTGWGCLIFSGLEAKVLNLATITSITATPASVEGGSSTKITGTVTIAKAAPASGQVVALGTSDSSIVVPSTLKFASGATTATFTATTNSVGTATTVNVYASANGHAITTVLVTSPHVTSISANHSTVTGGGAETGTVKIAEAAPAAGLPVFLASSDPAVASVPVLGLVMVAPGATSATFPITSVGVTAATTVTFAALAGGTYHTVDVTIEPATVSKVALSPTSVVGGASSTGTVTITGPAPSGGLTVTLSLSNSTSATLSTKSLKIAAGATTGTFTITTKKVTSQVTDTVTAALGTTSKTANLTIKT